MMFIRRSVLAYVSRNGDVNLLVIRSTSLLQTENLSIYQIDFSDLLYINGFQRVNPTDFGDPFTFSLTLVQKG